METNPINLPIDHFKISYDGRTIEINANAQIYHRAGRWRIDNEYGKTVCIIELSFEVPDQGNTKITFAPTHDFCEEFIDKMLEAEYLNDEYIFKDPQWKVNRPPQLKSKIKKLKHLLQKWLGLQNEREKPRLLLL